MPYNVRGVPKFRNPLNDDISKLVQDTSTGFVLLSVYTHSCMNEYHFGWRIVGARDLNLYHIHIPMV